MPPQTRASAETKQKFITFLEAHRDDIRYARKGYLARLLQQFEKETDETLTMSQLKRIISLFRLTHNCPIEYVPNYHYKPGVRTGFHNYICKPQEDQDEKGTEERNPDTPESTE